MQIAPDQKTIEGDLFAAFVEAGAISKANANDPKKSQLVRCARTDKGVHAAGNVISLKLIVEDENVVERINSHLSPQIRVWGIQRTINSFSAYQACDSRWYEYLIPTHSFLSPHPKSFLAKRLAANADEAADREGYDGRQEEMDGFWEDVEREKIKPIVDALPEGIKSKVIEALYEVEIKKSDPGLESEEVQGQIAKSLSNDTKPNGGLMMPDDGEVNNGAQAQAENQTEAETAQDEVMKEACTKAHVADPIIDSAVQDTEAHLEANDEPTGDISPLLLRKRQVDAALRELRKVYQTAKRSYRIHSQRLARIQPVLDQFIGTKNFHNYTVEKHFRDPSAKRHIRSFKVNTTPIVIKGTEWLSFKIHGQSFMMHQIRKMMSMVALVVRCGCDPLRIQETFSNVKASVPKAPALGLLLERPVFDSYNTGPATKFEREHIGFDKHDKKVEEFKQKEIYQRQFDEEEEGNQFHQFFAHVDNFRDPQLLYLSSRGFDAIEAERNKQAKESKDKGEEVEAEQEAKLDSDDEGEASES